MSGNQAPPPCPTSPTPNGNADHHALAEALATTDVCRVAGTVAIHLYEMEYLEDQDTTSATPSSAKGSRFARPAH